MSYAYTGGMTTDRRRRRRATQLGLIVLAVLVLVFAATRLLGGADDPTTTPAGASTATSACPEPPAAITVDVLNATTKTGLATVAADSLRAQRFDVGTVGNAPAGTTVTGPAEIRHGAASVAGARTLAARIRGAVLVEVPRDDSRVELVIGDAFGAVSNPSGTPSC